MRFSLRGSKLRCRTSIHKRAAASVLLFSQIQIALLTRSNKTYYFPHTKLD
jgi:hypothetical protein